MNMLQAFICALYPVSFVDLPMLGDLAWPVRR